MSSEQRPLIAHVIFRLDVGGLENGLVNLVNRIPHNRFRHAIICIDRSTDFKKRIQRDDVEIVEINKRPGRDLAATWRLYKTLRRLQPDILHTRNLAALDALLPGTLAGIKRRIHGEHGWDVNDLNGTNTKLQWLRRLYSPLVTEYVTVSQDLRRYLIDKVGIEACRIRQIYNGVDIARFSPNLDKLAARKALNPVFNEESILVGTVGRIQPVKDHLNLVLAFARLIADHPEHAERAKLVIVGDGDLRASLMRHVNDAGIRHLCWLPGHRDDIPSIMSCLDIFVQPSLGEGISNTILEAMACGLPVIATEVGGNSELVRHDVTGRLVPCSDSQALANALLGYLVDDERIAEHGRASRERAVTEFSTKFMLENYIDLYSGDFG